MTTITDNSDIRDKSICLYTPPFRFEHGYIWDAKGKMVADNHVDGEDAALRVRGWGRISYMENPEALQDEVGNVIALAMTEFWERCVIDNAEPIYQVKYGNDWRDVERTQYDDHAAHGSPVRIVYAAPPAPVVSPEQNWEELCRQHQDMSIGDAIIRASWWNLCLAAMLQGSQPVSNRDELPAKFKPVADLYGITSPTGSETTFTFDAIEASSFAKGGWSVQEYVELERYQEAVAGNSPVIPDGLCPCCGRKPLKHRKCSVSGCGRKHVANGLCQRHYDMKRREDPEQVEKFREANRRFTAKKRAQKAAAPQQEVKNG
ncbi:hypothetical protein ACB303_24365 [Citrobacter farmeri]